MGSKVFKFGIIGTGSIAATHAQCINEIENTTLVAMSASSPSRAQNAEKIFKVPVYHDYKVMMDKNDLDVVCICTQSGNHLGPSIQAAKHGIHILCEKPLETTVEKSKQMIDACKSHNVLLACVFQNRFNADVLELKHAINQGWLGKLLMGNASVNWYRPESYYSTSPWRGTINGDGGAALINQGIHTIDLLLMLMGDAKSVYGNVKTLVHNIEGEDTANAIVNFKNGAIGTVSGGTSLYPGNPERLEIYGEKGNVILEGGSIVTWQVKDHEYKATNKGAIISGASNPTAIGHGLHKLQIIDMIQAIQNSRKPLVNGEEGLKSVALISAIYASSKLKKEISVN